MTGEPMHTASEMVPRAPAIHLKSEVSRDVPFGVPISVRPVRLIFPFIFNQVSCLLQASKPY